MLVIAPVLLHQDLRTTCLEAPVGRLIQLDREFLMHHQVIFLVLDWDEAEVEAPEEDAEVEGGVEVEEDAACGSSKNGH